MKPTIKKMIGRMLAVAFALCADTAIAYTVEVSANGGLFRAYQDDNSWTTDRIRLYVTLLLRPPTSGQNYDFYYSKDGDWYWGNKLEQCIVPTRTGYLFQGIYGVSSGKQYYDSSGNAVSTYTSSGDSMIAKWTPITSTVTINSNGGKLRAYQDSLGPWSVDQIRIQQTATYDAAMPTGSYDFLYTDGKWYPSGSHTLASDLSSAVRTGYTLTGITDAVSGGMKYYNADGTSARTCNKTANTTFYLQWAANTYAVTLNANGGEGGTASVTATYDAAMPAAAMPTRTGYTFSGYYDAASGGTKYYNADGTSAKNWNKTSATTLYAHWTANTYTVTLNAQRSSSSTRSTRATKPG